MARCYKCHKEISYTQQAGMLSAHFRCKYCGAFPLVITGQSYFNLFLGLIVIGLILFNLSWIWKISIFYHRSLVSIPSVIWLFIWWYKIADLRLEEKPKSNISKSYPDFILFIIIICFAVSLAILYHHVFRFPKDRIDKASQPQIWTRPPQNK